MSSSAKKHHRRSIYACVKCHKSKMKCDIMTHGIPCSRCVAGGNDNCHLYPSKRRYGRDVPLPTHRFSSRENGIGTSPLPNITRDSVNVSVVDNDSQSGRLLSLPLVPPQTLRTVPSGEDRLPMNGLVSGPSLFDDMSLVESPTFGSLEGGVTGVQLRTKRGGTARNPTMVLSLSQNGNERQVLELFIDQVQRRRPIDKDTLVYVGETSPLSMLFRQAQDSGHVHMNNVSHLNLSAGSPSSSVSSMADSVVSSLLRDVLEDLLSSYFHTIHPYYPLINRRWFADRYIVNEVPPLLLSAVCFTACYHCELSVIFRAGYSSREEAKETFYAEAKRLFDEDQEEDYLVVLQAAVLLSFQGGKPRRVWNNRSWLAIAVTISEDLGLHRSISRLKMNETDKRHLRIIWWCIVFRDIMTSLNLGRPQMTCDSRFDFDMLTLRDFEIDEDPANPIFGHRDLATCEFLVENAKLNMLMMKVLSARYSPQSDLPHSTNLTEFHGELVEWRSNLPTRLDWSLNSSSLAAMYACMIYHHMIIFIFRPRVVESELMELCSLEQAVKSASEIASLVGRLGVLGTLQIPQDMYSIITTAVAVLMSDVRANSSIVSRLHLQICLMTLNQAKENWDHAPWLVNFFERMLQGAPSDSGGQEPSPAEPTTIRGDMEMLNSLFRSVEGQPFEIPV
ncbi:fungal-specific transcription factor domain-containing protein [Lipomyces kononenkoae]|uniref:Fungal-specific transcription factor domain-containing protein n=1 Tax=Lipomyces kononenkoae TaxID=34357 RepID=A0ACC3SQI5_LIPKO